MKIKAVVLAAMSFLLVTMLVTGCSGEKQYGQNVTIVRNGSLTDYPNVPIGKAFDQFFSDGDWSAFTSTDNQNVVQFEGNCTFDGKPAKMTIQFVVNPQNQTFMLNYADINGVALNLFESVGAVDKVLSEYKQ